MFSLVLGHIVAQIVVPAMFSFGWHTVADTYRMVASGHGAFELCLPSLGILYQNRMLRLRNIHRTPKTSESWGEDRRIIMGTPCGMAATACGSATLCHAVGVGGVGLRPSLTEISITDVLGIA